MNSENHYDALVIGCGMSGLGAGIRLALGGKKVLIVERHNAPGGLNSFYFKAGRKMDVGLHALTNYVPKGRKGPLTKLFRQLRIDRDQWALCPQKTSRIAFPGVDLRFSNDFALLESEIARVFPDEIDAFRRLTERVRNHDSLDLDRPSIPSVRPLLAEYFKDPLLPEMLLCPLLYYGSARENDIDFDQFCILFQALFLEGFARPFEGVRVIIRALTDKYKELGGERRMRSGVKRLLTSGGRICGVELDSGETITADTVISSIGSDETLALLHPLPADAKPTPDAPRLTFAETFAYLDQQPADLGWEDTIVFFNDSEKFHYERSRDLVDTRSGVICLPSNYDYGERQLDEGILRVTALASYRGWTSLGEADYAAAKEQHYAAMTAQALHFLPDIGGPDRLKTLTTFSDMFTPRTIEKYTGHIAGSVYGAPDKLRDGATPVDGLYICGTDQGFLGIVGAILSGISIANRYGLRG